MKTLTLLQTIITLISAAGMFFLLAWAGYLIRGEIRLGGEIFVPLAMIAVIGEVWGSEPEEEEEDEQ